MANFLIHKTYFLSSKPKPKGEDLCFSLSCIHNTMLGYNVQNLDL